MSPTPEEFAEVLAEVARLRAEVEHLWAELGPKTCDEDHPQFGIFHPGGHPRARP